jgi:hypothetical protein
VRQFRIAKLSLARAIIEELESRRLLSVSNVAAILGTTGINPGEDVKSGAVLTDLNALNVTGAGTALLHLYPGDYCTTNLSAGQTDTNDDTVMLDCYNHNITPTISFEYYTTGGYAALSAYPWTSIGQVFAQRYEPGGTWDQLQKQSNPNFNMSFGVTLYKAINEPDDDNPAINVTDYTTALQDLANGVHSVSSSLLVVPAGFAYPNKSGWNSGPLNSALQPLINAIAPLLNNGTLAGIDLHTYADSQYDPIPGGFAYSAYSNFVKVKKDAVPQITADIGFFPTEFDYHLSGSATEDSAAQGLLTEIWDNLGVIGDAGEPVTQLALTYTLTETQAQDSTNGIAASLSPWIGTPRAQTFQLVAQLTSGMSFASADPSKTGTYVLQDAAGDRKLWAWQDVSTWTNELGTSFKVSGIPATATDLQVYGWNGLRETIPLFDQTSYTVTGLPGSETYMFLASGLPPGWSDNDIGSPTLAGSGSDSSNTYTLVGSGSGFSGTSDQFNLAGTDFYGNGSISAEVDSLTGTASDAGVMLRDSSSPASLFADVVASPSGILFQYRTTAGAAPTTVTVAGAAPEYVRLSRVGNTYTGFYSPNGASWTQIGQPQTIDFTSVANQTSSLAGLAVTSQTNSTTATATFTSVVIDNPTLDTVGASSDPFTGTTTALNAVGADPSGTSALTYTWAPSGTQPAPVTYSVNGTNAAQTTNATFTQAGGYDFQLTISDAAGFSNVFTYPLTVNQTATSIVLTPPGPLTLAENATEQFAAKEYDQFGNLMSTQPTFTWTLANGSVGTVSAAGLYTAPSAAGNASVEATAGSINATAAVTTNPAWLSTISIATWNTMSHVLTVTGATSIIADPGTDEPVIEASGSAAVVSLDPASGTDIHIGGLELTDSATATVTSLGSQRSVNNYRLLVVGVPDATVAPTYSIDSTSTLNLADNDMAILYGSGASPLPTVAVELSQAYDGGAWDAPGLTSSVAKTSNGVTALGYGEAAALGDTAFDGLTLGGNAVLVKYTLVGDTRLQGSVGIGDYDKVLSNFGAVQGWTGGDFHYGGTVGISDYDAVLNNFGATLANVLPGGDAPALASAITTKTADSKKAAAKTRITINERPHDSAKTARRRRWHA